MKNKLEMVEFLTVTLQTLLIAQGNYLGSWGRKKLSAPKHISLHIGQITYLISRFKRQVSVRYELHRDEVNQGE